MLTAMGVDGFAERARRELLATGENARKRRVGTTGDLTSQEAQIARLAGDGLSNPEISTQLFLDRGPSSGTCARSSPSSASARAGSCAGRCLGRAGRPCPPDKTSPGLAGTPLARGWSQVEDQVVAWLRAADQYVAFGGVIDRFGGIADSP